MVNLSHTFKLFTIIGMLSVLGIIALGRITNGTLGGVSDSGGWDFYPFWYHGQLLRLGTAWAYDATGSTPATYTPALNFVISSLSYLEYPIAKAIWVPFIVCSALSIPWVLFYAFPINISLTAKFTIALSFYGLTGLSIAIRAGQPSIVVVLLIVSAYVLNRKKRGVLSGLTLGLALSKFSLSIPLMVYLAYKRQWLTLMVSIGVQIVGLLALVLLVKGSIPLIIANYRSQLKTLAGAHHINLLHIAGHFPHSADEFTKLGLILTTILFGLVWFLIIRHRSRATSPEIWQYTILTFLNTWGLLVFYIQQYDVGTTIFALSLVISGIDQRSNWGLKPLQHKILIGLTVVSLFSILSFPGLSYIGAIRPIWAPIRWKLMTLGIFGLLITTIWLWYTSINSTKSTINPITNSIKD